MLCTAFEERDMHRFRIFLKLPLSVTPVRIIPVIKRIRKLERIQFIVNFISIHKNLSEPQAEDFLEKLAEILLYNFHHNHFFLKLKIKKVIAKN